jgi:hypothetical protein
VLLSNFGRQHRNDYAPLRSTVVLLSKILWIQRGKWFLKDGKSFNIVINKVQIIFVDADQVVIFSLIFKYFPQLIPFFFRFGRTWWSWWIWGWTELHTGKSFSGLPIRNLKWLRYVPFCNSRTSMDGFRFWKQGYWANHLAGRRYHISGSFSLINFQFNRIFNSFNN